MDVERWQQVREVFEAAIDLPAGARDGFLCERCQGDAELRAEVERLLAADSETESAAGALDRGTPLELRKLRDRLAAGALVGRYRIVEVLGQGGMGTVYLAEQQEPVRRQVALKVVRLGMDPRKVLARFELERQTLAVMSHDAIAKVFDAGTTEQGQPYFVMEYVAGLPITDYCDRHRLSVEERIRLFQEVCAGVHHAHQKGVIHRDVKPSNVLVAGPPDGARPKIIDFGIARATDETAVQVAAPGTMLTKASEVIGTPEYMSPEQADPDVADVDTRTDIYSLGVVLYELH